MLRAICDVDAARLSPLVRRYPAVRAVQDFRSILDDPAIDAVAICTPVETHFPLASAALAAGKHVMVEKPLTDSTETAAALVEQARAAGRILHVDHTFVYSGAVRKIRDILDRGEIGDLLYLDFVRVNLGFFQPDVSVLWDLAVHDASIVTYLTDRHPLWVSAVGSRPYGRLESQAYVAVELEGAVLAHFHVNWLAPVKVRLTLVGGSKRMVVYDDLEPSEKIRVYDKGITVTDRASRARALVDYRVGDMFAPYIDKTEPLERACRAFLEAIESGQPSASDGQAGLAVVRLLEAAERSIRNGGERVAIEPGP
jgi:predicted dehydrogenase